MESTPQARPRSGSGSVAHSKPPGAWTTIWLTAAVKAGELQIEILNPVGPWDASGPTRSMPSWPRQVTTAVNRLRASR